MLLCLLVLPTLGRCLAHGFCNCQYYRLVYTLYLLKAILLYDTLQGSKAACADAHLCVPELAQLPTLICCPADVHELLLLLSAALQHISGLQLLQMYASHTSDASDSAGYD